MLVVPAPRVLLSVAICSLILLRCVACLLLLLPVLPLLYWLVLRPVCLCVLPVSRGRLVVLAAFLEFEPLELLAMPM